MSERKMAYIARIDKLEAIEGADMIQKATVGGWQLVTAISNGFKEGDLVVYCSIDCWIPTSLAPFLSKGKEPREYNGVKGEKLRTVRLRGQISQGLLLPLEIIDKEKISRMQYEEIFPLTEGTDVTQVLGIQKWEAPIPAELAGLAKGNFPSIIPKTDEERVQNLTKEWNVLSQYEYEVTEKCEGSSMTIAMIDNTFEVCSRNLSLKESDTHSMWKLARQYDVEKKMIELGLNDFAIQSEIVGEGIQGNHYGIKGHEFYVFSMYDAKEGQYLSPSDRIELCKKMGLKHVPIVDSNMSVQNMSVADVLEFANGKSAINPNKLREGLVFKRVDGQEHWKAISNEYLVKQN